MPRFTLSGLSLLLLASTALCSTPAGAAPAGSITSLPGMVVATGISGDGSKIVGLSQTNASGNAVYWTNGALVTPAISATDPSAFSGISGDGSTMVGNTLNGVVETPFAYRNGQVTVLQIDGSGAGGTSAVAANADGSIIVGNGFNVGGANRAIVWSGPNWQDLITIEPVLSPLGTTSAYGISGADLADHPIVVGEDVDQSFNASAYYWQDGVTHDIGPLGSGALGISADGSTIVGYTIATTTTGHAAIWTGSGFSTLTDIGTLGGNIAFAKAASADGSVVVGLSMLASNTAIDAFRYADGSMQDLNTLLSNAGVSTNVTLNDAVGVSANGDYIAANSNGNGAYLVYYNDGIGGLTNLADQQGSVDALGKQRQALAVQYDAYTGILIGDLDRQDQSNTVGVFGLAGSAVGGGRGHIGVGDGFSLTGGLADGSSEFGGADIGNGLMGALALRYDATGLAVDTFHPFGQIGASFGLLNGVDFTRSYPGGEGIGTTNGSVGSAFARLGLTADLDGGDQLSLSGEIGKRWLSTDAYGEAFSADNPFPAAIAAGTDSTTYGKLAATWSHPLAKNVDLTLRAAVGKTLGGTSGLKVATTGFGTLTTGIDPSLWAEAGAHVTWNVTSQSSLDLYATGIAGEGTGTAGHIEAGYHYQF